ncbi:ABC transporter ATP-binding protein [Thermocrispum municipale]|uniref:ABC transporter ATP-binding protein n=1 Tax=Thermocrispum municipale TaxID=37926 RepID=UPI0004088841|nr:ABC transporter ATP-binding protein [Thermocrispum municipale]
MATAMTTARLGAEHISRRFGAVQALSDVTFSAAERTIHALLGENGAGKTTLIRALSGLDQPDEGWVVNRGEQVRFSGPREAFASGIAVVQQELALSPDLTLLENLVLGTEPARGGVIDWRKARARAEDIAESISARVPWDRRAGDVEIGTQQQLEIIRCLYRGADTLILDEPSAVLAPSQIEGLLRLLVELREQGNTIILITHKLEEALSVADEVTVLRGGRVVTTQAAAELDRSTLSQLIVGEDLQQVRAPRTTPLGAVVLDVDRVQLAGRQRAVGPVSFQVREGEIFGVAGVAGNGQEDLVEALIGLRPCREGTIRFDGRDITTASVGARRTAGVGYISGDRRHEGLSITEPLVDNVAIGSHHAPPLARRGWFSPGAARRHAADVLRRFRVRHGQVTDPASMLSGGNQQKLVFGREISKRPRLLVAAQPTRGVDLRGIKELQQELVHARDDGTAIVLVSQELDELLTLSDRVLVMFHGTPAGIFDPTETDARARIGRAMLGQQSGAEVAS